MSFGAARDSRVTVYVTAVIALMLGILPLPQWLSLLWPHFLVLVVLYWSTMAPRAGGILLAFLTGICLDVFNGSQLGQHALALSLLAYLAIRLHLLTRAKPIFEQSCAWCWWRCSSTKLLWAVDGWEPAHHSWTLGPVITSALAWPVVVGLLGRLHQPR
jgi:rod shape-determining protein MreD